MCSVRLPGRPNEWRFEGRRARPIIFGGRAAGTRAQWRQWRSPAPLRGQRQWEIRGYNKFRLRTARVSHTPTNPTRHVNGHRIR